MTLWSHPKGSMFFSARLGALLTMFSFALLLSGCINNGIEWSEWSFTRTKPNPSDLVGIWAPTDATIKDMKEQGAYTISIHQLILRADGTFEMINMPDWWKDGFGGSGANRS